MPTESRILSFDHDEVFEALREYCNHIGRPLPADGVKGLVLTQDSGVRITVHDPSQEAPINFTEHEVGTALIMLCTKKDIPLPRQSIKSLEVTEKTLLLRLTIQR
jgi:hypothetical protein